MKIEHADRGIALVETVEDKKQQITQSQCDDKTLASPICQSGTFLVVHRNAI